jgi:hypothetical protein
VAASFLVAVRSFEVTDSTPLQRVLTPSPTGPSHVHFNQ